MTATKAVTSVSGIEQARRRFDAWRATRTPGSPIPDSLWAIAIGLARQHGVQRTARALGLEYNKLKRLSRAVQPASVPPSPAFVELFAPQPGPSTCRIELQDPRGMSIKIEMPAANAALIIDVCRAIVGEAA